MHIMLWLSRDTDLEAVFYDYMSRVIIRSRGLEAEPNDSKAVTATLVGVCRTPLPLRVLTGWRLPGRRQHPS